MIPLVSMYPFGSKVRCILTVTWYSIKCSLMMIVWPFTLPQQKCRTYNFIVIYRSCYCPTLWNRNALNMFWLNRIQSLSKPANRIWFNSVLAFCKRLGSLEYELAWEDSCKSLQHRNFFSTYMLNFMRCKYLGYKFVLPPPKLAYCQSVSIATNFDVNMPRFVQLEYHWHECCKLHVLWSTCRLQFFGVTFNHFYVTTSTRNWHQNATCCTINGCMQSIYLDPRHPTGQCLHTDAYAWPLEYLRHIH